jgi:hypothetical protein
MEIQGLFIGLPGEGSQGLDESRHNIQHGHVPYVLSEDIVRHQINQTASCSSSYVYVVARIAF